MQLASVCSAFAAATEQVLRGGGRLCLEAVGGIGECQLGSRLMLKWARHLRHIQFYDDTMCLPGSQDFMAAASSLRSVSVHCDTVLAAAEANYLLSGSSSRSEVALSGDYQMSKFPTSVRDLKVAFSSLRDKYVDVEYYHLGAFIANVASCRLPDLQNVSLRLYQRAHCAHDVALRGDVLLPRLEGLCFTFSWHNQTSLILSWLKRQPCKRLELTVTLAIVKLAPTIDGAPARAAAQQAIADCSPTVSCRAAAALELFVPA